MGVTEQFGLKPQQLVTPVAEPPPIVPPGPEPLADERPGKGPPPLPSPA